ncbi:MAG: hypothetical protein Ta2E_08870 [Mycoplasmoidaceae bacterium]|nr:MAG: hypothetical protein Ta2E_08870 [Mycoplasmoidaceae bacterium]
MKDLIYFWLLWRNGRIDTREFKLQREWVNEYMISLGRRVPMIKDKLDIIVIALSRGEFNTKSEDVECEEVKIMLKEESFKVAGEEFLDAERIVKGTNKNTKERKMELWYSRRCKQRDRWTVKRRLKKEEIRGVGKEIQKKWMDQWSKKDHRTSQVRKKEGWKEKWKKWNWGRLKWRRDGRRDLLISFWHIFQGCSLLEPLLEVPIEASKVCWIK